MRTKQKILEYLDINPTATYREIQAACGMSSVSTVSHHLKKITRPSMKSLGQLFWESRNGAMPRTVNAKEWSDLLDYEREALEHGARILCQEFSQIAAGYERIAAIADMSIDPEKAQKEAARSISLAILRRGYSKLTYDQGPTDHHHGGKISIDDQSRKDAA